ncbi:glycosyl transferase family protein [Candidatus Magnetoovum chiemensis]|nr:glycosyl transferase family protein [Candidatus Magnetoovum chiemensis]
MNLSDCVSIIVRTKNRPKLLEQALQSIASQLYRPIDVILVNDGGCKLDIAKLNNILGNIPLNYIEHETNIGRSKSANDGIRAAKGAYICFLDDDDELFPEHVSTIVTFLKQSDYNAAYTDSNYVVLSYNDVRGEFVKQLEVKFFCDDFNYNALLLENYITLNSILFKRHILEEHSFDEALDIFEDWDLLIRVGADNPFYHIKKITCNYIHWDNTAQATNINEISKAHAYFTILRKHKDKIDEKVIYNYWQLGINRRWQTIDAKKILSEREQDLNIQIGINNSLTSNITALEQSLDKYKKLLDTASETSKAKDREIEKHKNTAEISNKRAKALEEQLEISKSRIRELERHINTVGASVFWKTAAAYYELRDDLIPQGTKRRQLYNYALETIKRKPNGITAPETTQTIKEETPDYSPLSLPLSNNPTVSIVIPVFNKAAYTYKCLKSIIANTTINDYEVIVVNNASKDNTLDMLSRIKNVRIVNNQENMGFVDACNRGAAASKGKYLVFLNNDTEVRYKWLEALIDVCKGDKRVGIVGSKLIYPDGRLQEAGGIIFSDGNGYNFGRYDDPNKPEYCYVKEVDYCSGASILIPKTLFEHLGGFDTRFAPAYYEDTDISFSVRSLGYKVVFQPASQVIHHEGITAGTDTSSGFKAFQNINRTKFLQKWSETLKTQYRSPDELFLAKDRCAGKRILIVNNYIPTYDKDSGSLRMYYILKILTELGHKIIFLPDNLAYSEPYTNTFQQMGVEVLYGNIDKLKYLKTHGKYLDIVFLCRPSESIKYIKLVRKYAKDAKVIYDTVDLHFLREERMAKIENNIKILLRSKYTKSIELSLCAKSDITLVVTEDEKEILKKELPSCNVQVLSNIHEVCDVINPFDDRKDIMFIGGFQHPPNEDAMLYFIAEIFPLIKEKLKHVKLYIVGSNPTKKLLSLNDTDIVVTGYVDDVTSYFQNVRVFVCPLRYGAGMKGKVGQSMSFGVPVVTTRIGAEGIGLEHGKTALIADDAKTFADHAAELYLNKDLWYRLSQNGIELIRNNYCLPVMRTRVDNIINSLMREQF